MAKAIPLIGGALAILLALSGAATAQSSTSWQVNRGNDFVAAGICAPSSQTCVRLQCLKMDGGGVQWMVDAREPGGSPESTSVSWRIDGLIVSMTMNKAGPSDNGIQSYDAEFSPATHDQLVRYLRTGNRLTVASDQFVDLSLSLRGSSAALKTLLAECPLTASMGGVSPKAPAEKFTEPHDAVVAMASKQGCQATEEEIFAAITGAGFGDWDANQYVVIGSKSGFLKVIDRTNFTYQISDCQVQKDALTVDPSAASLTVKSSELPQPVRAKIGEIALICGTAFKIEGRDEKAVLADDIDGDGTYDFLLDHAQFCPDAVTSMCGASHCPVTLLVSNKGTWRQFDYILQGYKEFSTEGFLLQCPDPKQKAGVFLENGKLVQKDCG